MQVKPTLPQISNIVSVSSDPIKPYTYRILLAPLLPLNLYSAISDWLSETTPQPHERKLSTTNSTIVCDKTTILTKTSKPRNDRFVYGMNINTIYQTTLIAIDLQSFEFIGE